jgi:hypothetical protein
MAKAARANDLTVSLRLAKFTAFLLSQFLHSIPYSREPNQEMNRPSVVA